MLDNAWVYEVILDVKSYAEKNQMPETARALALVCPEILKETYSERRANSLIDKRRALIKLATLR